MATTIEDLYDGALDDEEIGNFVQSQIDAAKKAVDKITKKKPQISTNKSAYLEAKKKWEGELREAERKALYWNDVKAEVEKITTPADERTDDNSGSEGGKDSEGEVRTRDEDSDESEATSEESGNGASENVRKPNFSRRERTAGRSNERQGDSAENGELTEEKKVLQDKVIGWLSDENIEWAEGKDFKEVIEHFGNIPEPIAAMPQIVRKNVQSLDADYLYCGKAYMIDHQANHHPELDKTNTSIFRQFLTVMTISRICLMVVI